MDDYGLGPAFVFILTNGPTVLLLGMLVVFLARHFRVSLLLMAIAETVSLGIGAYSQYLLWSGNWNEVSRSAQLAIRVISIGMTVLFMTGLLLLLLEWSKMVRERSAVPPVM